ncbi:cytochrome b N-terminal domain-containing protein [Pseudarthrobacter enclensis]|uniref:Cytochrome bc1 complex cytochrome b subunit n=1 Tax=Pseudarthrobacter enclensis TaxID=993070 RepID=A0ABT9RSX0_9MICC|nr:cytochrome b N-terminal domain-containing protein [Pseudarthrobacter enclensis]MDP9888330.1 quinol-cytochrome oxidoreductase complex cytochrome b subunit [Pseudarthrobacter enclensis]
MRAQAKPADGFPEPDSDAHTWTGKTRKWLLRKLPPDKLLPGDQPSYVMSWAYVFGMGAVASLVWIIMSGVVLGLNGPQWYHVSSLGRFVNSSHLWSVELFFIFLVVHLWLKFWMAAWRGGRVLTWITGMLSFVVSIVAAFTGYLLQTNFDSQWIAFEAKDALNSVGVGAWFNVANVGQIFVWHVTLLPLAVGAVVVLHVLLVRVHGVVPPLEAAVGDAQLRDNGTESSNPREPGQPVASAAPRTSADPKDAAL